jgi:hypothetical protein
MTVSAGTFAQKRAISMMKFALRFIVLTTVLACSLPVHASTLIEVWVSRTGTDNGTCGDWTTPCQSFIGALPRVTAGGQINVMDAGDFGFAEITKSVSIVNATSGTAASVSDATVISGGPVANVIIVAGANGVVTLRGLVLNTATTGGPVGSLGVLINNASQVNIENCLIMNNSLGGIEVLPSTDGLSQTLATNINVNIQDSTITGNNFGIKIAPTTTTPISVVVDKTRIKNNNGGGLRVDGTSGGNIAVSVSDSSISLNTANGVVALSGTGNVMVNLTHDIIASNGQIGIEASGGNAAVLVDNTSILNNATGALSAVSSGRILTYQNNRIVGSAGSGFTGTAAPQ